MPRLLGAETLTKGAPLAEWLEASSANSGEGLFFIGAADRRITFYSQQVRALRLAHAIIELGVGDPTKPVAVVGAGAAGATAALALALAGRNVFLQDPASDILHLQSASPRLLHPHIYEWPKLGSLDSRAGLPILDWSAASGGTVCAGLIAEFKMAKEKLKELEFQGGRLLVGMERADDEWKLSFRKMSTGTIETRRYGLVLLSMGFGEERRCGDALLTDYWMPTAIGTAAIEPVAGATYLVSGNGDGGLTDLLGLAVRDFEHVVFTQWFLDYVPGRRLHDAAVAALTSVAADNDVELAFREHVWPVLDEYSVLDAIVPKLRDDRVLTINSRGSLFAAGKAAQLNQVMAYAVMEAAKLAGRPIARSSGKVTGVVDAGSKTIVEGITGPGAAAIGPFDHVVLRHGPDIKQRYEAAETELHAYSSLRKAAVAGVSVETPAIDVATYKLFRELAIDRMADHASATAQRQQLEQERLSISIELDRVAGVVIERGGLTVAKAADDCERLPAPVLIQVCVAPKDVPDPAALARLAQASGNRIDLRAHANVHAEWKRLLPAISVAAADLSRMRPCPYGAETLSDAVDRCLLRLLDVRLASAAANGGSAPLGAIAPSILQPALAMWADWRAQLDGDEGLRHDFLRWLADVTQSPQSAWNGDHGQLGPMANALIMAAAASLAEPLVPTKDARGNLAFGFDGIAIGSGCEAIGLEPIAIRSAPEDWNAEALILSGASDVIVRCAGTVRNGGATPKGMMEAKRVAPAIIQRSYRWTALFAGGLNGWKEAVDQEFEALRMRQEAALQEIVG